MIANKGSQKWLQVLVNKHPKLINSRLKAELELGNNETIDWRSPLKRDGFREYQDGQFLTQLYLEGMKTSLRKFWPKGGPVWDGLAKTSEEKVILVEAKSHIIEIKSGGTGAQGESRAQIRKSLAKTKVYLNSKSDHDWSSIFYQYTNRLAHLYWLRKECTVEAFLVYVCFVNDTQMNGPTTKEEWIGAITLLESVLGVRRHKLSKFCSHIYIDISDLN